MHFRQTMEMNQLIFEYPRGLDIQVSFVDADGNEVDSVAMTPPLLLRLGPNLELERMSSGNLKALLDLSRSESDDDDDDDMSDEEDSAMEDDTDPGANNTIDLVTSDEDEADDDADDEEEEEDYNSDLIVVSYNTDV